MAIYQADDFDAIAKKRKELFGEEKFSCSECSDVGWLFKEDKFTTCHICWNPKKKPSPEL